MANIKTQFTIPFGDGEPPNFFFKKTGRQAASHKRQATGNRRAGGPIGDKRLIHRLSTEKIFRGFTHGI